MTDPYVFSYGVMNDRIANVFNDSICSWLSVFITLEPIDFKKYE